MLLFINGFNNHNIVGARLIFHLIISVVYREKREIAPQRAQSRHRETQRIFQAEEIFKKETGARSQEPA